MGEIIRIASPYALAEKALIRSQNAESKQLINAIYFLGEEIGKLVIERYGLVQSVIRTPMGVDCELLIPSNETNIIISTKDDYKYFGKGVNHILFNSKQGYMNFSGLRGPSALSAEIRDLELPIVKDRKVSSVIIAKSVLATGCTAISLTRRAVKEYSPEKIIISSVFYSLQGISELEDEFPNAQIVVIGDPDELREDGMLIPGVGNIDERIRYAEKG